MYGLPGNCTTTTKPCNMIQNPFLPSPAKADAWNEGFIKGFVAISSPEPSENIAEEDMDAFNQGVQDGSQTAENGIAVNNPCIPALEEHGPLHEPGMAVNGAEIAHGVWEIAHLGKIAAGAASIIVALIELACTLPVHMEDPETVLPQLGQPLIDTLATMGLDSMEVFLGAGMDINATDCEIQLTPLFASADKARDAAAAMNRPQWMVVSWRTDACNSFKVCDSGGN